MEKQEDGSMVQCHMKTFEMKTGTSVVMTSRTSPKWGLLSFWAQVTDGLWCDSFVLLSSPWIFTISSFFFHLDRNPFYFPLQIRRSWSQDFFPPQDTSPGSSCPLKRARILNLFSNTWSSQCQSVWTSGRHDLSVTADSCLKETSFHEDGMGSTLAAPRESKLFTSALSHHTFLSPT